MKCNPKDCKNCVHFVDIQKHPLFRDMQIQTEDGKPVIFEGCIFHLQTMFIMQLWKRQIGVQAAIESNRNVTSKELQSLTMGLMQGFQKYKLQFPQIMSTAKTFQRD